MSAWSDLSAITSMRCGRFGVGVALATLLLVASSAAAQRRVTIRADDGGAVAGAYYEPSRRPAPAILLLHMLGRSHADWDSAAEDLADAGFAVLALDFRSGQDAPSLLRDVRAGKAFLRERSEILQGRVGIAGASLGANVALLDAADDPGVASVALLSPGIDYRGLRTEGAMKKYAGRPALLAASTKDPYSWRSVRHLSTIGPGTREMRLTEAAAHGTALLSRDPELIRSLVDWFRRTLL
jgi:pimeloyl-ACP methyl ester carboxylesterase